MVLKIRCCRKDAVRANSTGMAPSNNGLGGARTACDTYRLEACDEVVDVGLEVRFVEACGHTLGIESSAVEPLRLQLLDHICWACGRHVEGHGVKECMRVGHWDTKL